MGHGTGQGGNPWKQQAEPRFRVDVTPRLPEERDRSPGVAIVRVSTSHIVDAHLTREAVADDPLVEIDVSLKHPTEDAFSRVEEMHELAAASRRALDDISDRFPGILITSVQPGSPGVVGNLEALPEGIPTQLGCLPSPSRRHPGSTQWPPDPFPKASFFNSVASRPLPEGFVLQLGGRPTPSRRHPGPTRLPPDPFAKASRTNSVASCALPEGLAISPSCDPCPSRRPRQPTQSLPDRFPKASPAHSIASQPLPEALPRSRVTAQTLPEAIGITGDCI